MILSFATRISLLGCLLLFIQPSLGRNPYRHRGHPHLYEYIEPVYDIPVQGSGEGIPSFVFRLLDLVNEERRAAGLMPLCLNAKLVLAAQAHSQYMAETRDMSHIGAGRSDPLERITRVGFLDWSGIAENVAYNQPDAVSVMRAWMSSHGHRANILGPYEFFGAGMVDLYWTQDFASSHTEVCVSSGPVQLPPPPPPSQDIPDLPY